MATAEYEGGAGGKSRKRPLRRPSSTPYDRPPSAIRGPRPALPALAAPGNNGWLSKLVDPASRIITKSASRLFSSLFRKRLTAPPAEAKRHSSQQVPAVICANLSPVAQEKGVGDSENRLNNSSANGAKQRTNSDPNGIGELEQLLKQKTFTRVEFDRLTELVRSRTIEPSKTLPVFSHGKEKDCVPAQGSGAGCVGLNGDISNSKPMKEFASPAELAKAYMGSRPSELTYTTLNLKNLINQDNAAIGNSLSNGKERSDLMPKSVVRFSGTPEVTGNGYMTPRLFGRSAMHRMSCSPYFKCPSTATIKNSEPCKDGNFVPSALSPLVTTNSIQSTGKKVNKRRSSVLDGDFGYSGPIRRIRQKSNLMSPSRDIRSTPPVNLLSPPLSNDIDHGRATKTPNPLCLDGKKRDISDLQQAKTGNSGVLLASVDPMLSQSSEMKRIPPQQLHELVSSPKKKTSELKSSIRDEVPSKLTTNMLHERALQSMKDIDSSRFFNLQGHGNLDSLNNSYVPSCSSPQKLDGAENITSLKPTVYGVKVLSETLGKTNPTTSAIHTKPDSQRKILTISGPAAVPLHKRPAFQMTAPEEDLDDDDFKNSSEPRVTGDNKLESKILEYKTANSVTAVFEKPLVSSAESAAASSAVLNGDVYMKSFRRPITAKDGGFSFPIASGSETSFQMAPMPPVSSSLVDRSYLQKEQLIGSAFVFGSKEHAYELPTTTASLINAGGDSTRPVLEFSSSKEEGKYSEARDSLTATPSGLSSTSGFSVPSLTNGSVSLSSSTAYADRVMPFSNASEISVLSTSTASSTLTMPFILSTAPLFSTIVSNSPASYPILVSSLTDSKATVPEPVAYKASPFGSSNSIASVAFPLFNTDKNSSLPVSPATSSSMNVGISSVVTSSLFSSSGSDSSALSVASAPNIGNGIFGITAPAQSIPSNISGSNNTSHDSTNFFATAGSIVGTTESQNGTGVSQLLQPTVSQFSSLASAPTFGMHGSSSSGSSNLSFGSATFGSNPFSSSGVISSSTMTASSSSVGNSSFGPAAASSLFGAGSESSTSSLFGSSTSSPSSGFLFGQPTSTSSSQTSMSAVGSSTSTGFSFGQLAPVSTSQMPASSILGSTTMSSLTSSLFGQSASTSSTHPSTSLSGSNNSSSSTVFSFGESVTSSSHPSSVFGFDSSKTSQAAGFSFGLSTPTSSSQPSTSVFGSSSSLPSTAFSVGQPAHPPGSSSSQPSASIFCSGAPLPSAGFSFGQSAPTSAGFTFGASSAPTFSFTSSGNATLANPSSPAPSAFGLAPAGGFGSSPGNDQMNVEDSMADDTIQAAAPTIPVFGQANSSPATNFAFDSSTPGGASVFQFAGQQNSSVPQGASPFQAGGNLQFSSGGSFSLGTGDKSGRKVVRVNRNKYRRGR